MDSENEIITKDQNILHKIKRSIIEEKISDVILPNLTNIPSGCFRIYHTIVKITIPKSVIEICDHAFDSCQSLREVIFEHDSNLQSIGSFALYGCTSLLTFEIPKTVTYIGPAAFRDCLQLSNHVVIPPNVKVIENQTFHNCISLKSIEFPPTLEIIGTNAFINCTSLFCISLPSGLKQIHSYAFHSCTSILEMKFPPHLESIDDYAFYNCSNLKSVDFPSSLVSIGEQAFLGCPSLKKVEIPFQLEKFKNHPFPIETVQIRKIIDDPE